jgi:hypothetical protein
MAAPTYRYAMMSMRPLKLLGAALFALLACVPALVAAESAPRVAVVAFGLFGDQSVFESEASGAAKIVADRFGGSPVIVRANTKSQTEATVDALANAMEAAAKGIDAENDVMVVILTSHGSRAGLAVKAGKYEDLLWPQVLGAMLNHSGVRHRAVIISACYSGVFIPLLASPDTLVITAADADHTSFGCQDGVQWTYFGDAFFNHAMRRAMNLRDAFDMARILVSERELLNRLEPSNPQMAGGESFVDRLRGGAEHVGAASQRPSTPARATAKMAH